MRHYKIQFAGQFALVGHDLKKRTCLPLLLTFSIMEQLYVLQLQNGKYYVGKSANPAARYKQHKDGNGAAWTQKHKPVKFLETRSLNSEHDENNLTKDLMKTHGVNNVRGGSYTKIVLDDSVRSVLEMELVGNADKCYTCKCAGHFARDCPLKDLPSEEETVWECSLCGKEFKTEYLATSHDRRCSAEMKRTGSVCHRCGRTSHFSPNCYAKTHVDGYELESEEEEDEEDVCSTCGRDSHTSDGCYAKKHLDGSVL